MESDKDKQNKDTETGREKKFLNGWTTEQERLMSEWSDIAMCYRWLHDHSEKIYHSKTLWINIPVIVLSTLGGTANFGIQSIFSDDASKQLASFAIGGVSLLAGLLTTINNYLRYPQLEESNRVASIAWGKFQRLIAVELSLHPDERMDSMDFLKVCRSDLDRLIEQSPPIPPPAIRLFEFRFGSIKELKKPDICGALEHTRVYESSETRLKQVAVDAALLLRQRKNTLAELLSPKIQEQIATQIHARMSDELDARKIQLEQEIVAHREEEKRIEKALQDRQRKLHEELDTEKRALQRERAVSPVSPVQPVPPVQRSTFEHRLQRRHFPSTVDTHHPPPLFRGDTNPLSARVPRVQDADYPIVIPESSQPYSKSVDSSPVMQPQLGPNPTEFVLPDHQNTVIIPQ